MMKILSIGASLMVAGMLSLAVSAVEQYKELKVEYFQQYNFTSKIDNFNTSDTRTYQQRYWVDDQYWDNKTGPVFMFICGEGRCKPPTTRGYPYQICQDVKCLFYVLEHRYYGESQPFPDWSTDSLKYLNATQALADLNTFMTTMDQEIQQKYGGSQRKWVTIGGSYPGALSAWFKHEYPNTATVSWSSSGVILPIRNFTDFDLDIWEATSRSGPGCPAAITNITNYVQLAITDQLTEQDKEIVWNSFDSQGVDNADLMWYLADVFSLGAQYGGRSAMCDIFMSVSNTNMSLQLSVVRQYAESKGTTLNQYDRVSLSNIEMNYFDNMRQWTW